MTMFEGRPTTVTSMMLRITSPVNVTQLHEREFRFCGLEVKQDSDMPITVTAVDNTMQIKGVAVPQ